MTEREAFEKFWQSVMANDPGLKFARQNGGIDPVDGEDWIRLACKISWLAATSHANARTMRLVEAVEAFRKADQNEVFLDIVEDSDGYIENAAELNKAHVKRGDALKHMLTLAAEIKAEQN